MSPLRRLTRAILQFIGLLTLFGLLAAAVAFPLLPRILQVEDKIEKAGYILPLAGDWHRLIKAAELYKAGYAPVVLLSNAIIRPPSRLNLIREEMGKPRPEPRAFRKALMLHLGVPEDALLSFGHGHISTIEEAEAFRDFLKSRIAKSGSGRPLSVILVTSPFHTRRAKTIFSDTMPGIRFMVTSPQEGKLKAQWWRDQRSAILSVVESFKFAHYLIGGRFSSGDLAR
jgi:uncharacterized SAM-binding protein YcdF (DUF218 family)